MRNVFIDLGSFRGDIIRKFMSSPLYRPDFEIHAFEANPLFKEAQFAFYPANVIIHREAVGPDDGEVDIFVNRDKRLDVQGTSIFGGKITGDLDPERPIKVPCINFGAWLRNNFSPDDNILVKCNIEGAEYPLFDAMLADGSITYIKRLFLRLHWRKIGMLEEDNTLFLQRLLSVSSLAVQYDYNFL